MTYSEFLVSLTERVKRNREKEGGMEQLAIQNMKHVDLNHVDKNLPGILEILTYAKEEEIHQMMKILLCRKGEEFTKYDCFMMGVELYESILQNIDSELQLRGK